jgi:uncharacterized membrane protein (DUF2068 family)
MKALGAPGSDRPEDAARRRRVIQTIGLFKIVKGVLLVALGVGLLRHQEGIAGLLGRLARHAHLDPDGRYVGRVLEMVAALKGGRLEAVRIAVFLYAAVFLTEGTGLLLGRRWAEYFAVGVTGSLIPLEVFELLRRPGWVRAALLVVNVLIVWYLASGLRRRGAEGPEAAASSG